MSSIKSHLYALNVIGIKEFNKKNDMELQDTSEYLNKPIPKTAGFQELFLEDYRHRLKKG